jgi:hypothetical protein
MKPHKPPLSVKVSLKPKRELPQNSIFRSGFAGILRRQISSFSLVLIFLAFSFESAGQVFQTASSGNWNSGSTWVGGVVPGTGDNAVINAGHIVSLMNDEVIKNLTINAEGVLNADNKQITVNGDLIIDGIYTSKNSAAKNLQFYGNLLGGIGSIIVDFAGKDLIIYKNVTIQASSRLTIFGNVTLQPNVTVTNNSLIEITGDLKGSAALTSVWTNGVNSSLTIGGALLATGILNASAAGSTVTYNRLGDQVVKSPAAGYQNLSFKGSGMKTLQAPVIINGNLDINNSATFNSNNLNIELKGNWRNQAQFAEGTGLVMFTGTSDQSIINSADEYFYSFTLNKTGGEVRLGTNIIVKNTLTLTAGKINTTSYKAVLGTGIPQLGTLFASGGYIKGKFERWINGVGSYEFPVGDINYQKLQMDIIGLGTGGSVVVEFIPGDPGNNGLPLNDGIDIYNTFVEGYWTVDNQNGFDLGLTGSFNLQLDGTSFTSFIFDAVTRILTRPNIGSNWGVEGSHVAASLPWTAKRTGLKTLPAQYSL